MAQKIAVPRHSTNRIDATRVIVPLMLSVALRARGVRGVSTKNRTPKIRISNPPRTAMRIGIVQYRDAVGDLRSVFEC